jgi:hypothetical protein
MLQGSNPGMGKRCFVQSIKTGSGDHPTTYPLGTLVLSQGNGCWGMKLTTYGYPLLRLRLRESTLHTWEKRRDADRVLVGKHDGKETAWKT